MAKLSAIDRQKQLVDLISHQGTMKITELATYFNVSRETIRRDLQELDNSGAVKKWYGAVMPVQDFNIPPVEQRMASFHEQKLAICKKALSYVSQRSTIFIDAGSTALTFASLLKETAGHTIITNSMPVVNELVTSQNHLISVGGSVDPLTFATMGTQTLGFIEKIRMDMAFLGTSGFAEHNGPSSNSLEDVEIKHKIIQNSRLNFVLADSSKASSSSLSQYANWHDIDYLITDNSLPAKIRDQLTAQTEVVTV
ncbi:DeoR/GlpR transcriptional regulator [Lacticaseibacillus paracasei]|uniref:DeoR/GlpR family DNA-binding transcription regulator n=1 Tax=Lacticaseibacillus paracasei TaxID=1597 RepID=UPI0021A26A20|nr:DeoR/GlpR family DNA-binding transcription regulator [Lacticaseibacillus paracasei]MCT3319777.1 DeoR/GlpR transcriptional regulator [Lacticaseibacillus paracasei]